MRGGLMGSVCCLVLLIILGIEAHNILLPTSNTHSVSRRSSSDSDSPSTLDEAGTPENRTPTGPDAASSVNVGDADDNNLELTGTNTRRSDSNLTGSLDQAEEVSLKEASPPGDLAPAEPKNADIIPAQALARTNPEEQNLRSGINQAQAEAVAISGGNSPNNLISGQAAASAVAQTNTGRSYPYNYAYGPPRRPVDIPNQFSDRSYNPYYPRYGSSQAAAQAYSGNNVRNQQLYNPLYYEADSIAKSLAEQSNRYNLDNAQSRAEAVAQTQRDEYPYYNSISKTPQFRPKPQSFGRNNNLYNPNYGSSQIQQAQALAEAFAGINNPYNSGSGLSEAQAFSGSSNPYNTGYSISQADAFAQTTNENPDKLNSLDLLYPLSNQPQVGQDPRTNARAIPQNELINLKSIPGAEFLISCSREGEFFNLVTPSQQCLVCACVRNGRLVQPVCASCSGCNSFGAFGDSSQSQLEPEPYNEPSGNLQSSDYSTCDPLPSNRPFQHPLNPCQICECTNNPLSNGRIHISCVDNPQCVIQHDAIPNSLPPMPVPPSPVPTPHCQKFPKNVVFPHPKDNCKECKCLEPGSPYGVPDIICLPNPHCEPLKEKSFNQLQPGSPHDPYSSPGNFNNVPPDSSIPPSFIPILPGHVMPSDNYPYPNSLDLQSGSLVPDEFLQPDVNTITISSAETIQFLPFDVPPEHGLSNPGLYPSSPGSDLYAGQQELYSNNLNLPPSVQKDLRQPLPPSSDLMPWPPVASPASKFGPLLGPPPHKTCKPYPANKPFQHPWDDCQVCTCAEYFSIGEVSIEVNCFTKASCCVEVPTPPRVLTGYQQDLLLAKQTGTHHFIDEICETKGFGIEYVHPENQCKLCTCELYGKIVVSVCRRKYDQQCSGDLVPVAKGLKVFYLEPVCEYNPPNTPFTLNCNLCVCQSVFNYVVAKCTRQPNCDESLDNGISNQASAHAMTSQGYRQELANSVPRPPLPWENINNKPPYTVEPRTKSNNNRHEIRSLYGYQPASHSSANAQASANNIFDNDSAYAAQGRATANAANNYNSFKPMIGQPQFYNADPRTLSSIAQASAEASNSQHQTNSMLNYYGHQNGVSNSQSSAAANAQAGVYSSNYNNFNLSPLRSDLTANQDYSQAHAATDASLISGQKNAYPFSNFGNLETSSFASADAFSSSYSPNSNAYPYSPDGSESPPPMPDLMGPSDYERTIPRKPSFYSPVQNRLDSTTQDYGQEDASTPGSRFGTTSPASIGRNKKVLGRGKCHYVGDMYHHKCQACYCRADASNGGALYATCIGEPCS